MEATICKVRTVQSSQIVLSQLFQIQLTLSCNLPLHELKYLHMIMCVFLCSQNKKHQKNTIINFPNCTASQVAQCQSYTDLSRDSFFFLWNYLEPDWSHWCTALTPVLRRLRQVELSELEDSLVCIVTFSSTTAIHFSQEWKEFSNNKIYNDSC